MASIENKVYSVLSGAAALTALTTEIYPDHRPAAAALPAVVYTRLSGIRVNTMSGYSNLENVSLQIYVYSSSIDQRREISDQVIIAMTGASQFKCILDESPFDDYDDEIQVYERVMDFSIWNLDT